MANDKINFPTEATTLFSSSHDYEATLRGLAGLAVPALADWCFIDMVETDGTIRPLTVAHHDSTRAEQVHQIRSRSRLDEDDPLGIPAVIRGGLPAIHESAPDWLTAVLGPAVGRPDSDVASDVTACMSMPLVAHGRSLGAMTFVSSESGRKYRLRELILAEDIALQAAIAAYNARLCAEAVQAANRLEEVLEVGGAAQTHDLDRALDGIVTHLGQQIAVAMENASVHARLAASLEETKAAREKLVRIERLRAIGELAGGVAHDFNNLLAAITGRVDLLMRRTELPPDVRADLQVIQQAALDGAEAVRRLQGLNKPSDSASFTPVDLIQVCHEALEVTRGQWRDDAQRRGIQIEVIYKLEPVPPIAGRPSELREALMNLIINAVDAMPRGGRLTLRTRQLTGESAHANGDAVCLEVSDSGVGMTEEVRQRVFEPYFTTKGNAGTGLGLPIVYGIVTQHNGQIRVESAPSAGSTFYLTFPSVPNAAAAQSPSHKGPAPLRGRLLAVDDHPTILRNLSDLLRMAGHEVVTASTGEQALATFAETSFDVVLTDLGMPRITGFDVADAVVREAKRRHEGVAVLLITGWSEQIDEDTAARHGIFEILHKPFRAAEIEAAVQRALVRGKQVSATGEKSGVPKDVDPVAGPV